MSRVKINTNTDSINKNTSAQTQQSKINQSKTNTKQTTNKNITGKTNKNINTNKTNKNTNKNTKQNTNTENTKTKTKKSKKREIIYTTHSGHKLTPKEAAFIDLYLETGNQRQSVLDAGYNTRSPGQVANKLLRKDHIASEIVYRMEQRQAESIASATEILQYFTSVMRGEVEDQFGLEASLAERTKAAQELAKRQIDIVNKVNGNNTAEVVIKLDWDGMGDNEEQEDSNGQEEQ